MARCEPTPEVPVVTAQPVNPPAPGAFPMVYWANMPLEVIWPGGTPGLYSDWPWVWTASGWVPAFTDLDPGDPV